MDEARAKEILKEEDLEVSIDLGMGEESATYWTCDLSKEYIEINAGSFRPSTLSRHTHVLACRLPIVRRK